MTTIQDLEKEEAARLVKGREIPPFQPGDTVRVNVRIKEGERERVQAYEGVCIGRSGHGLQESFTVRKISFGEGVERVFPVLSPMIEFDRGQAPRGGAPRQALLPARPPREVGPHRRTRHGAGDRAEAEEPNRRRVADRRRGFRATRRHPEGRFACLGPRPSC